MLSAPHTPGMSLAVPVYSFLLFLRQSSCINVTLILQLRLDMLSYPPKKQS
jgi:hypothetical protein